MSDTHGWVDNPDEGRSARAPKRPMREPWFASPLASDGLERLARAHRDYTDKHGYYLPVVAALAHAALTEVARLRALASDQIEMAEQSEQTLRHLHTNWRQIADQQDADGGPLIENILYWLIEDVKPDALRDAHSHGDASQ